MSVEAGLDLGQEPGTAKFRTNRLRGLQRTLKRSPGFLFALQTRQNITESSLRLGRVGGQRCSGLRLRKRVVETVISHRDLRPRDVIQRGSQRNVEVAVVDENSVFNDRGWLKVQKLVVGI